MLSTSRTVTLTLPPKPNQSFVPFSCLSRISSSVADFSLLLSRTSETKRSPPLKRQQLSLSLNEHLLSRSDKGSSRSEAAQQLSLGPGQSLPSTFPFESSLRTSSSRSTLPSSAPKLENGPTSTTESQQDSRSLPNLQQSTVRGSSSIVQRSKARRTQGSSSDSVSQVTFEA